MAKKEALNSDLDFIREFEELKIKQRLLIENLKKRGQLDQDKLFLEINAKLDFLVKIFKDANAPDEEVSTPAEGTQEEAPKDDGLKLEDVVKKIEDISKVMNDKFDSIETQLTSIYKKVEKGDGGGAVAKPLAEGGVSSDVMPPAPDFQAKIDDLKGSTDKGKKSKKWFENG